MTAYGTAAEVANHSRDFHRRGWMQGTSGNLSVRHDEESFWITASGRSKGELTEKDFLRVGLDGHVHEKFAEKDKPSAETSIHQVLYRLYPDTGAIYHVHSVENNVVSQMAKLGMLKLPPIEMIKGFNIWDYEPDVSIHVVTNTSEVAKIAAHIEDLFEKEPPQIPAFLIENHGITVWAPTTEKARNYIELIEFIFKVMVERKKAHR